jgi:hypothetical protein
MHNKVKYLQSELYKEKIKPFIEQLGINDSLSKLPSYIEVSDITDEPTNELILNFDSTKSVSVYGDLRFEKSKARLNTPPSFLKVYDQLIHFKDDNAK